MFKTVQNDPVADAEPYVIRAGATFYKPNRQGYTSEILAAGIYSKADAIAEANGREGHRNGFPPREFTAIPLSAYHDEIETAYRLICEKRAALGLADDHVTADIRHIEARHKQDEPWFTGGLHDSSGYVVAAHKDRGVLLERLKAKSRPVTPEMVRKFMEESGLGYLLRDVPPPPLSIPAPMKKAAWCA